MRISDWSSDVVSSDLLAQQVQRRPGRAVGEVGDVVLAAAREPVLRVEAGNLQLAVEPELFDQRVGVVEEIVVVEAIGQHLRVHDKGGVDPGCGRVASVQQLFAEGFAQRLRRGGRTDEHTSELKSLMRSTYAVCRWTKT